MKEGTRFLNIIRKIQSPKVSDMTLKVYNTASHQKEEFVPLKRNTVSIYVCGVTPYNFNHVGHSRSAIDFDVVRRYLEFKGYSVKYVLNFTDVDDKIIKRAQEEGGASKTKEIAERYIKDYLDGIATLGNKPADVYPRVSEHIPEIIALVEKLIKNGKAYVVEGDVYYDISKFPEYGKLSGLKREQIVAGARISVDERKRSPEDFALWKAAKPDEPSWPSPWGKGRPGWHIECSAMSMKYLGETLDIHGGGSDLIFPHHENEIAQSEGATGKQFVRYWMHNGMINVHGNKMSKSTGNFITTRDMLNKYPGETIRFFVLSSHYRSPVDFDETMLGIAQKSLQKVYNCISELRSPLLKAAEGPQNGEDEAALEAIANARGQFIAAMDDDFNTPLAIAAIFELVKGANFYLASAKANKQVTDKFLAEILELGGILNLFQASPDVDVTPEIKALLEERERARKERNYELSDKIRDRLLKMGIVVEDRNGDEVRLKKA